MDHASQSDVVRDSYTTFRDPGPTLSTPGTELLDVLNDSPGRPGTSGGQTVLPPPALDSPRFRGHGP